MRAICLTGLPRASLEPAHPSWPPLAASSPIAAVALTLELEQVVQVADRCESVTGRRGRAVRLIVAAGRSRRVERMVLRGERRQSIQSLDQLEGRDVLRGLARGDDALARHRGDDPE